MTSLFTIGDVSTVPKAFLLAFPALFSIVNPIGGALIFAQVTAGRSHAERSKLAGKVGFYSMVLLLISLWAGSYLLSSSVSPWARFGSPAVSWSPRGAGACCNPLRCGRLKSVTRPIRTDAPPPPRISPMSRSFRSPCPSRWDPARSRSPSRWERRIRAIARFPSSSASSIASIAIALIVWIIYSYADFVVRSLGETGSRIVTRLVALILLAIGVQIIAAGVQDLLLPMLKAAG